MTTPLPRFTSRFLAQALLEPGLFLIAHNSNADPRSPGPPTPETSPIFHESFDEYYFAGQTNSQLVIGSFTLDESWSGYALDCAADPVTPFLIPAQNSDSYTNITSDPGGAFRVWVMPFWSSASGTNGGSGAGAPAALLQFQAVNGASAVTVWSLDISADGNTLALHVPTDNGVATALETPITWQAGYWHNLVLDSSPGANTTALFVDGAPAASGSGWSSIPTSLGQLTLGLRLLRL